MLVKLILNGLLLTQIFIVIQAYTYVGTLQDEDIFSPCDEPDVLFYLDYIDRSKATFEMLSNGSVHIKGDAIIRKYVGEQKIKGTLQMFKKNRGQWVNTIYSMSREDTCTAIFDPKEVWSQYTQYIAEDQRKCPFFEGQTFTFDSMASLVIDLPDPRMEGEYMGQFKLHFEEIDEVLCFNIKVDVNRM